MAAFESIVLTYSNENRVTYQLYAEFFRLIGVYVCEDLRYPEPDKTDLDLESFTFSDRYRVENLQFSPQNEKMLLQELNRDLDIESRLRNEEAEESWYDDLTDIFVGSRLLQAGVTLQYFRMRADEVLESGNCFKEAAEALDSLMTKKPSLRDNRYIRYAKLFCKQKANLARFLCEEPVVYYVNDLAEEGLSITEDFSDFTNAWVLLGFIYEISQDHVGDTIDAFRKAISREGNQPYASSICYWLGKKCEEYVAMRSLQEEAYQRAYALRPKYRNIYKVAVMHMDRQEWDEALSFFEECIYRLDRKKEFLDPLEQEYYFKVRVHMSFLHLKRQEYADVIENATEALRLRDKIEKGKAGMENEAIRFYREMYGNDLVPYIELALQRMGVEQVNQYLAIAYQELGLRREAEECWSIARR